MPLNHCVFLPFRNISNKIKDIGALRIVHQTYMYTIEVFSFSVNGIRNNFVNLIRVNLTVRKETQTLYFFQATVSLSISFAIKVPP